jgi:hypothetical protein
MADTLNQSLTIVRGNDISIVLSGASSDFASDPSAWAMQFSVARNRGQTPVLTITAITISGSGPYVATIPLTRAQTSLLALDQYDWDLHRTTSGSVSVKAGGALQVLAPVYPPASA